MSGDPDFSNLNNYFETVRNQFHKNIYARTWRVNPFVTLFPREEYDAQEGLQPTVITSTHELPTAYPTVPGTGGPTLSTGTGNNCTPATTATIKSGAKERTYALEGAAFETELICLTDIQFSFQADTQVKNKEKGLTEYSTVYQSDWYRMHCIGMIDNKVSTSSGSGLSSSNDSNYDFSGLGGGSALPTAALNWIHLTYLYDALNRAGGPEFCSAHADGEPIYALTIGPGYKRALFQDDEQVRATVDWNDAGTGKFQNFKARGITRAVNGFLPNVDDFPIRYDSGLNPIYPTVNIDVTKGRGHTKNTAYATVANGGSAVYEVAYIIPREIFSVRPRPIGKIMVGKQSYKPTSYAGEVRWINNPDMALNKLGNQGMYRIDFQWAAKPMHTDLGYAILTLAQDANS